MKRYIFAIIAFGKYSELNKRYEMFMTGRDAETLEEYFLDLQKDIDHLIEDNNKNKDNINFLARSNCKINAGVVVKDASIRSGGNGGGSNKFAQGGGKTIEEIDNIFEDLLDGKYNE